MTTKEKPDLSITVTSFYMKLTGFWLTSSRSEERKMKFAIMYAIFTLIIGILVEGRDFYFTWGDRSYGMYLACNMLTVIVILIKVLISCTRKAKLLSLIQYAQTNFWHSNYDPYEQSIVDNCKHTCVLLVCVFNFFAQGTIVCYVVTPIVANIGKNESERVLPFHMPVSDLPLSMTPYFEVAFAVQVAILYQLGVMYICFDNFLCIINLHTASQFRILQYRLKNTGMINREEKYKISEKKPNSTDIYSLFKNTIQQHQALINYCRLLEEVFSPMVLGQVLLFSLLICLDGYLIVMEDAPGSRRLVFGFHISGCFCQLLMFTYSCDCLIQESTKVAHAGYGSFWPLLPLDHNGRMIRKDLLFIIMRAKVPCCLTASGFAVVSLETYAGILSTAVSYFTLLRNQSTFVMRAARNKDISIAWTSFLLKIAGLWLADNEDEKRHRKFALMYTINTILIGTLIAFRDIYFSWGNFSDCVYIACNISYLAIDLFKISVLYAHRREFYDLIRFMQKTFWNAKYNTDEKLILNDGKRLCVIFTIIVTFCTQGTCTGYMVTPLIANIGRNESERMLPFNMWVDFPTSMSPYFEILFTVQVRNNILCVYHVGMCSMCFDSVLCIANLHAVIQFRILRHRLINLTSDVAKDADLESSDYMNAVNDKLKQYVRRHQIITEFCKELENIFSLIVLGQVLFISLVLCLVGYQLFLMETPPARHVSLMLNMVVLLCQLYMLTYSCDLLMRQSMDVANAVYSTQWQSMPMSIVGKNLRRNVKMIILRSNKPCCLTTSGFSIVSLETYTSVLSTAMSCFTLLRESSAEL
ncbi:uncharacterized protein LOC108631831 [Ceratina calcarata]|uniref:Uncharacterized protein LOC108631831 n=1 Tax=Ceratina calcarata TaxID=156304 RepID=A0AAJ7SBG9_9HYME|nr:uncharacterized protein LOC108631831 [Ceratina calcarata]